MNLKEETRIKAMRKLGITRLPAKVAVDDGLYTCALLLVLKSDGKEYYAVRTTDNQGMLRLKYDFEPTYSVVSVLEVRPVDPFKAEIGGKPLGKATRREKTKFLSAKVVTARLGHLRDDSFVPRERLDTLEDAELDALCVRMLRMAMKSIETQF